MLEPGAKFKSAGGSFLYVVQGPICRLYDREELPWPSCSLAWKGKQPSWNRIGRRFVPDMGTMRFESYSVKGMDEWGVEWDGVQTLFNQRLKGDWKTWWYSPRNERNDYPEAHP